VLVQSAFSYLGTEIVALTAGEAENVSFFASAPRYYPY
jgi:amino acid permease